MASFRICATNGCNARLPDYKNDGHSRCKDCVGHLCTPDNKCEECSLWTEDVFCNYIKHRRQLELTRARKAKIRKLNKDERTGNVKVKQHEISSSVGSSAKSDPSNVIDLDVSRSLVTSFDSSASSLPVPKSPTKPSAPFRDQGNTDLSKRVDDLTVKVNLVFDLLVNKLKSNPQTADLGPMPSPGLSGLAPQSSDVLPEQGSGGTAADGRPQEGTCPLVPSQHLDRSRKRSREPKDSCARVKRSRNAVGSSETRSSPRNARQSSFAEDKSEVRNDVDGNRSHMSPSSNISVVQTRNDKERTNNDVELVNKSVSRHSMDDTSDDRYDGTVARNDVVARDATVARDDAAARNEGRSVDHSVSNVSQGNKETVPRSSPMNLSQLGHFDESVELRLQQICYENHGASPAEKVQLMKKFLKTHDPHNTSWVSARSVRSQSHDDKRRFENSVMSVVTPAKTAATNGSAGRPKAAGKELTTSTTLTKPSANKPVLLSPSGIFHMKSNVQLSKSINVSKPSASSTPKPVTGDNERHYNSLFSVVHKSPPKTPLAVKKAMRMVFGSSNPSSEIHRPSPSPRTTDRPRPRGPSVEDEVSGIVPKHKYVDNPIEPSCKIIQLGSLSPKKGNVVPDFMVKPQSGLSSTVPRITNLSEPMCADSHIGQDKARTALTVPESVILTNVGQNTPVSRVLKSVPQKVPLSSARVPPNVSDTYVSKTTKMPVTCVSQVAPQISTPPVPTQVTITSGLDIFQQSLNPDNEITTTALVDQVFTSSVPQVEGVTRNQGKAKVLAKDTNCPKNDEALESPQLEPLAKTPLGNQTLSVVQALENTVAGAETPTSPPIHSANNKEDLNLIETANVEEDYDEGDDKLSIEEHDLSVWKRLTNKIFAKYPPMEEEPEVDIRTPYQIAFQEPAKKKPQSLRLNNAVMGRMKVLDTVLSKKKELPKSNVTVPPFMKFAAAKYYGTGVYPDTLVQKSSLNSLAGILDDNRTRFLPSAKVCFTAQELEALYKSTFRQLEIWSFATSAFEVLGDCFRELKDKVQGPDVALVEEYGSYISSLDKAGVHGIGEAAHMFSNLILKKREQVISMANKEITEATKSDLLYAPVSSFKLFPPESVKETSQSFRQSTETSALAQAVRAQLLTKKKPFRNFDYRSPLQAFRGRGGRGRKARRGKFQSMPRQNREYFKRRDRYINSARNFQ